MALTYTVTLSLVIISWGGTDQFWTLMSTISYLSVQGRMKKMPGPLSPPPRIRPSRKMTTFSYSWIEQDEWCLAGQCRTQMLFPGQLWGRRGGRRGRWWWPGGSRRWSAARWTLGAPPHTSGQPPPPPPASSPPPPWSPRASTSASLF